MKGSDVLRTGILMALLAMQGGTELGIAERKVFPESITALPDGTLIAGSTANGAIYRLLPGETQAKRWIEPRTGAAPAVFGVLADPARKMLWACHVDGPPGKARTALARYRSSDGTLLGVSDFPGPGLCNDIAFDARGTVYATDTANARVMRMKPGGRVEQWFADPALGAVDGIVAHRSGRVIVNDIQNGKLFAIPVGRDGAAGPLRELTLSRPLERPDGMRLAGPDTLLVVEGTGRLARVTLNGDTGMVETIGEGLVEPVGVAPVGSTAYVVQGHISYLSRPELKGRDPGPHGIYAIPFKQ